MEQYPNRIIFHLDMDSFFASCEFARNPELKNKAVVIGSDPKEGTGRGVVSTCNYNARKYGIHSGQPISTAYKKCPTATFIKPDIPYYKTLSNKVMEIILQYCTIIEPASIDEAYMDMSDNCENFKHAAVIARTIKKEVKQKLNLTCSIGIAPNKSTAKIASDINKPDGLTIVTPHKIIEFLHPLKIKKINGIGKKTAQILNENKIFTIKDIADTPISVLTKHIGSYGKRIHDIANGIDYSKIYYNPDSTSISREHTFEIDTNDKEELIKIINTISDKIKSQLDREKTNSKTISIKLRYEDFTTITRAKTLYTYTNNLNAIKETSIELFGNNYEENRKVRLIGVKLSNFSKRGEKQTTLKNWF